MDGKKLPLRIMAGLAELCAAKPLIGDRPVKNQERMVINKSA